MLIPSAVVLVISYAFLLVLFRFSFGITIQVLWHTWSSWLEEWLSVDCSRCVVEYAHVSAYLVLSCSVFNLSIKIEIIDLPGLGLVWGSSRLLLFSGETDLKIALALIGCERSNWRLSVTWWVWTSLDWACQLDQVWHSGLLTQKRTLIGLVNKAANNWQ